MVTEKYIREGIFIELIDETIPEFTKRHIIRFSKHMIKE